MRHLVALLMAFTTCAASAAPLPPAARAEVDALLARLSASACEFNRNGSWHDAAEAKQHLLRKLAYLEDKNLVVTTEHFIERGASSGSSSGKPYLVRCGPTEPVESRRWLGGELKSLRALAAAASAVTK